MPLRIIARCLRGHRQKVGLGVGVQRLAKPHVQILLRPVRTPGRATAEFEMLDVERVGKRRGRFDQRAPASGVGRRRAAVDAERQRHQRMAEQAALHLGQRQDAGDRARTLGDQIVRAVAKDVLDDLPPADAVKERRFGTALDECFPGGGIGLRRTAAR